MISGYIFGFPPSELLSEFVFLIPPVSSSTFTLVYHLLFFWSTISRSKSLQYAAAISLDDGAVMAQNTQQYLFLFFARWYNKAVFWISVNRTTHYSVPCLFAVSTFVKVLLCIILRIKCMMEGKVLTSGWVLDSSGLKGLARSPSIHRIVSLCRE